MKTRKSRDGWVYVYFAKIFPKFPDLFHAYRRRK